MPRRSPTLLPVCLDIDESVARQEGLSPLFQETIDLRHLRDALRLYADDRTMSALETKLGEHFARRPARRVCFGGSGDFHHLTIALLKLLPPPREPLTLVVVDNHPDWYPRSRKESGCGTWVRSALELPFVEEIVLLGQRGQELLPKELRSSAPLAELASGRVILHPYELQRVRLPLVRLSEGAATRRTWFGTELVFDSLMDDGVEASFRALAARLAGRRVYLSLDLDCLSPLTVTYSGIGLPSSRAITAFGFFRSSVRNASSRCARATKLASNSALFMLFPLSDRP